MRRQRKEAGVVQLAIYFLAGLWVIMLLAAFSVA